MKVVDELMTPGCPQCAIKHLSAALYHRAKEGAANTLPPSPYMVCVCTAYINLVEVRVGYRSHLWYAVGALVRAEEHSAVGLGECVAREARLMLEQRGENAVQDALACLRDGTAPSHAEWAAAHFDEARRELPAFAGEMRMDDLIGSIEKIRDEFFPPAEPVPDGARPEWAGAMAAWAHEVDDLPGATVAPEEKQNKKQEGEPTMATTKKSPAKGAKCAAKGGKTAKATKCACKGGKTAKAKK